VSSAVLVATAFTLGRRLAFHKVGQDGTAKCDAPLSDDPAARVFGAVYAMDASCMSALDRIEGRGKGYEREQVQVVTAQGPLDAFAYLAEDAHIDPGLEPFHWYKCLVVEGARHHGFPESYVQAVAALASVRDPERDRAARNLAVLDAGHGRSG